MPKSEIREPEWAHDITSLVMRHEGITNPPDVTWVRSRRSIQKTRLVDGQPTYYRSQAGASSSSGVTQGNRIVIRLGLSDRDARVTLLHELAHWATGHGHNEQMYQRLFEYAFLFGAPGDMTYSFQRECRYMRGPAVDGWMRFSRWVKGWPGRAQTIAERLTLPFVSALTVASVIS